MKRTILPIALALCLLAIAISGCSPAGEEVENPGAPATQIPAASASTPTAGSAGDSLVRTTVPNVVDMDAQAALQSLEDAGLTGMIRWQRDAADRRTVLSQSTPGGLMLAPGSYVQLVVSLGPAPEVPDPPYIVLAREQAAAAAEAAPAADDDSTPDDTTPPPSSIDDDPNDIPGVYLPKSPLGGTLSVGDPHDVYRVAINAGQTITLSVGLGTTTSNPDFHIKVYPPTADSLSDATVASTTTGAYPRNVTYTATTTGSFYIDVRHSGTGPGSGGQYLVTWTLGM